MKKAIIKFLSLLLLSALFLGATYSWSANPIVSENDNIILSWYTMSEENLKEIVIERSVVNGTFSSIGIVQPKGNNSSYSFIDKSAFKVEDGFYIYRLKFVNSDGTAPSYSNPQSVSHLTSVNKRTWGSIKALFR